MSNPLHIQQTVAEYDADGVPIYKWPPFPNPPPGVSIIPFKDFKPSGIQIESSLNEDMEIDGLGIPTVTLAVKHDNSGLSGKKRSRRIIDGQEIRVRYTWHEEWEVGEDQRIRSAPNYPKLRKQGYDTVAMAFEEFRKGRDWGPPDLRLNEWYNQLIFLVGLNPITIRPKISRKRKSNEETTDSDEEFGPSKQTSVPIEIEKLDELVHKKAGDRETETNQTFVDKYDHYSTLNMIRNQEFMYDPHQSIKIFFSSFFRDRGMLWENFGLRDCPRVIEFFLNYMVKTGAHPEQNKIRKALEIAKLARRELPMTKVISSAMPDKLSRCLTTIYGSQVNDRICWGEDDFPVRNTTETEIETPVENNHDTVVGDSKEQFTSWTVSDDWGILDNSGWGIPEIHNLIELMGPTTLPLTHRVGYVEDSTRRITEVIMPNLDSPKLSFSGNMKANVSESIEAVNPYPITCSDPIKMFAEIILEPYEKFASKEARLAAVQNPILLKKPSSTETSYKVHNPEKDQIRLLVSPTLAFQLKDCIGMGIGGTFVQLIPEQVYVETYGAKDFWYSEKVLQVLTSYWTEKSWTKLT